MTAYPSTRRKSRHASSQAPRHGSAGAIARLHLTTDSRVVVEFDTARNGHCTVWGDADHLITLIRDVVLL